MLSLPPPLSLHSPEYFPYFEKATDLFSLHRQHMLRPDYGSGPVSGAGPVDRAVTTRRPLACDTQGVALTADKRRSASDKRARMFRSLRAALTCPGACS